MAKEFEEIIRWEWQTSDAVANATKLVASIKETEAAMLKLTDAPAKASQTFEDFTKSAIGDMGEFARQAEISATSFSNAYITQINKVRVAVSDMNADLQRTLDAVSNRPPPPTSRPSSKTFDPAETLSNTDSERLRFELDRHFQTMTPDPREVELAQIRQKIIAAREQAARAGEMLAQTSYGGPPGVDPMFWPGARPVMQAGLQPGRRIGEGFDLLGMGGLGPSPQDQARQQYEDFVAQQRLRQYAGGPWAGGQGGYEVGNQFRRGLNDPFDDFVQNFRGRPPGTDPNMEGMAKNVARDDYERFRNMQLLRQETDEAAGAQGRLNNRWLTFGTYIAVGMAIHSTLVLITNELQNAFNQAVMFESVATRLSVITGGQSSAGQIIGQYASMAQYGIQPDQAGQGMITGTQVGASPQMMENAARVAQFMGDTTQYTNVLHEMLQVENLARATGIDYADSLDYIATAAAKVPTHATSAAQAIETYYDALQSGLILSEKLGMDPNQAAFAIQRAAFGTESTPDAIRTTYERVFSKLIDPKDKTKEGLAAFGIDTSQDPAAQIRQVADAVSALIDAGRQGEANELLQILFGGTPMQGGDLSKATLLITQLSDALNSSPTAMRSFAEDSAKMSETFTANVDEMRASWEVFLASMGTAPPVQATMEGATVLMDQQSLVFQGKAKFSQMSPEDRRTLIEEFNAITKPQGLGTAEQDLFGGAIFRPGPEMYKAQGFGANDVVAYGALEKTFYTWAADQEKASRAGPILGPQPGAPRTQGPDWRTFVPPVPTERTLDLPKGADAQQFATTYAEELKKLQAVPGYAGDEERTRVALMGEKAGQAGVYLSTMSVNMQAATNALRLLGDAAKDSAASMYGGVSYLPEGQTLAGMDAGTQKWEDRLNRDIPGAKDIFKEKDFYYIDPATQELKAIRTTSEAIALYTKETSQSMKQISGVFNIPSGGEFLVSVSALQAGFVGSDRVGGGRQASPTSGGPGSGLNLDDYPGGITPPRAQLTPGGGGRIPGTRMLPANSYGTPQDLSDMPYGSRPGMRRMGGAIGDDIRPAASGPIAVTVNNRNVVMISGRVVSDTVSRGMGRSLSNSRRGSSGGAARGLMM